MFPGLDCADFTPWDSPDYERDAAGNIKIYNPEPEPNYSYTFRGLPFESMPLITELTEIKNLLKQILNKLQGG